MQEQSTDREKNSTNIHHLVSDSCRLHLNRTAIIYFNGKIERKVLFDELLSMSNSITHVVRNLNFKDTVIGYLGNVNAIIPSLFLSILQQSASFTTINLNIAPTNLIHQVGIKWIFADSEEAVIRLKVVDCQVEIRQTISLLHGNLFLLKAKEPSSIRKFETGKWKLAYVIQTSGTTGKPKTVFVPHQCILPNIIDFKELFDISPQDVVGMIAPLTFDPSIVEMFTSLISGSTLLIIPQIIKGNPASLCEFLCQHRVSVLQATPSLIKRVGSKDIKEKLFGPESHLRVMAFGGESCPSPSTLSSWRGKSSKVNFFNIYGITEVSSWATAHRITDEDLSCDLPIPLGKPLSLTELEVRNADDERIDYGEGMLFIGGSERICFVDDDISGNLKSGKIFRATGDYVSLQRNGRIDFLCRNDGQVKRYGKKLNLTAIESVACHLEFVDSCSAVFDPDTQFVWLFVVVKTEGEFSIRRNDIYQHLKTSGLPSHAIPNDVISTSTLPVTEHGKINADVLLRLTRRNIESSDGRSTREFLIEEWKKLLNVGFVDDDSNFLSSGGDSIRAIQFAENVSSVVVHPLPLLVDKLLSLTFSDVCAYVVGMTDHVTNMELETREEEDPPRHTKLEVSVICRGNVVNLTTKCENVISLQKLWVYDLGKCIDASPLIICQNMIDPVTKIYIGSHSHRFASVELESGKMTWDVTLNGRIESSACLSLCGRYVIVGCYDHYVYCLRVSDGELHWKFKTEAEVKSSSAVDPLSGNVYVGSHDCRLYCLDVEFGTCTWWVRPGEGSVFASPCVLSQPHRVYVATLDGILCTLDPSNGRCIWKKKLSKPIFASPSANEHHVFIGDVGGTFRCYSHLGIEMWTFESCGPIFSTPVIVNSTVVFGCHDCQLYCLEVDSGCVQWKVEMDSAIYATPFCLILNNTGTEEKLKNWCCKCCCVVSVSSRGQMIMVSAKDGALMASYNFPGEIFSSPVVANDKIVVGCRDNYIYCIQIE